MCSVEGSETSLRIRHSERIEELYNSSIRTDEGITLETSAFESL